MSFQTIMSAIFSISFLTAAVTKGMPLLFGALGEIVTEKSGNLNLGIPGIMYMGGIGGLVGAYFYEKAVPADERVKIAAVIISILVSVLFSSIGGLIYSVLTTTLKANQNVSGLALTTFGIGLANFLGGSLAKLAGTTGSVSVRFTGTAFKTTVPFLSDKLGIVGKLLFSYGFLTYLSVTIAIIMSIFLAKSRAGLNLRAVGESPAAADAVGISVTRYKYLSTVLGSAIAGLGGLFFVMEYIGGVWQNNALGDTGWLAIALVIFAVWKPARAIWGSILFGGLCVMFNYLAASTSTQEILKMLPYVVTIIVLIITSLKKKRENMPPAHLGLSYFREER